MSHFTVHDDPDKIITAINEWIDEKDMTDFDTEFLDSLSYQLERGRILTGKQMKALINIYDGFRIGG